MAMCVVLMGASTWVQVVKADELNSHSKNRRAIWQWLGDARGPILAGGVEVANSVPVDDEFGNQRQYGGGDPGVAMTYSSITGFQSWYQSRGLEKYSDDYLSSNSDRLVFSRLRDVLTGRQPQGAAVETTIVPAVQEAAFEALRCDRASANCLLAPDGNYYLEGAIVAIEPSTGKILAMVSTPAFDPNPLASHDAGTATQAYNDLTCPGHPDIGHATAAECKTRAAAIGDPMNNKAITERYFPGSTFKIITAAAALETGRYTPHSMLYGPRELTLPQSSRPLTNYGGSECNRGSDQVSLADSMKVSCNTSFAQLGLDLGQEALRQQAQAFGFDGAKGDVRIPMPVTMSKFPDSDRLDSPPYLAYSSIGQDEVQATPLQMAMVSAAIANRGTMMQPYLVHQVKAPNLSVLSQTHPKEIGKPVSPQTADQLAQMMELVVTSGSATPAQIPGVRVAAKTGTAQDGEKAPHVWFTGFAPVDNPQVAVVVFVKNGGDAGGAATGGKVAAPMAKKVIEAVLNR